MDTNENHRRVRDGIRWVSGLRRVGALSAMSVVVIATAVPRASAQDVVVVNVKVDFRQAANNDSGTCGTGAGHPCALGDPHWIGSIVQQSNSKYFEGMSNPQRLIFQDIADTTGSPKEVHSLSFSHQTTKGGIHAYDFLTSWAQAQAAAAVFTPPAGGLLAGLFTDACGLEIGPPSSMETTCTSLRSGADCVDVPIPDDTHVDPIDGSYLSRILAYEAIFGNRTIRICGNQPINSASITCLNHIGPDTGDSDVFYTIQWSSNSNEIVIEFAGHLAVSGNPTQDPLAWGINQGSAAIAGGPYHFNLQNLGGLVTGCVQSEITSLGSQDNQIKGADIIFCRPGCPDGSTCTNGLCADGSTCGTLTCDDQKSCTDDICDEASGTCSHVPFDSRCDDGNPCTNDLCDAANGPSPTGCVNTPATESTPCEADGNLCTNDHCNGAGACVLLSGKPCPPPSGPCDGGSTCNPATGACDANPDPPLSTPCERDGSLCTNDHCDGFGSCVFLSDKPCPPDTQCETFACDPATGTCVGTPLQSSTP